MIILNFIRMKGRKTFIPTKKEFQKYNIYNKFPDKDIDSINSELISYLKDKEDNYNKELFNQKEITHLKDVKVLVQRGYIYYYSVLVLSALLFLALFLLNKKHFSKNLTFILFFSGLFTLVFTIILLIIIIFNFNSFFTTFHNIFFPQGGYLFTSSDNIIKLYPEGFFYDIAKNIFISIFFYANILIGIAIFLFLRKK